MLNNFVTLNLFFPNFENVLKNIYLSILFRYSLYLKLSANGYDLIYRAKFLNYFFLIYKN